MIVNSQEWEQLRECCRSEGAFAQLQQILNLKTLSLESENFSDRWKDLDRLADSSEDIFIEYDIDLRLVRINLAGAQAWGRSPSELVGKTNQDLLGQKASELDYPLQYVLKTGKNLRVNQEIPWRTGAKIYNSLYTPIKDHKETVIGVICVGRDVTYLKHLQNQSNRSCLHETEAQRYKTILEIIQRIRLYSLDLQALLQAITQEIQHLLNADRVVMVQLDFEWGKKQGKFIAETLLPDFDSLLNSEDNAQDFLEVLLESKSLGQIVAIPDIYYSGCTDRELQILRRWQIRGSLIIPLYRRENLWGVLAIHQCRSRRDWHGDEIELVTELVNHLETPIQQAELLTQTQKELEERKTLARVITRIRETLDLDTIFQATVIEVRQLLNADRVGVFRFDLNSSYGEGEFISEDVAFGFDSALEKKVNDHCFSERFAPLYQQGKIQAVSDVYTADLKDCHLEVLTQFQIRANLVVPLLKGEHLWGLLCIHQCSHSRHWQPEEIEFVSQIAQNLEIALQQTDYIEKLQDQAAQLAIASARQKSVDQQKLLYQVVEKIRNSLDIQTIFNTTTAEVRAFLNVDRVAVYRFNSDWSGYFVAESVVEGWNSLFDTIPVIQDSYLQETKGGRYVENLTFAVDNIYTANHADCHVQLLEQLQTKAYIIVPILQGRQLWGLLAAYQNDKPRQWQEEEVKFLAQIGSQFGVALQQAELFSQTQKKAEELAQDLRQTQTKLVQNEKMSSLGQLVAGVAHEINNPVNFIYGNLGYVTDYTEDLLELVELYQQKYSEPDAEIELKIEEIELDFLMEDLPKILSSMKLGAERIRQLVLSLRNFSRLDESEMKAVDIHEGIDSTLLILQHRLKSKQDRPPIEVIKDYGRLPKVDCYAAQLNQVFMNLLSNAIDELETLSKEPSGLKCLTIKIKTSLLPATPENPIQRVKIAIQDNGHGIPETIRKQIFDPFFTTKPVGKGTGLGLSISYQIVVEKHKGTIECHALPDQGTEFIIEIPVVQRH